MCKTTTIDIENRFSWFHHTKTPPSPPPPNYKELILEVKAFYVRFWIGGDDEQLPLPPSITLLHNLQINGSSEPPALVTLHRLMTSSTLHQVVYGSREVVRMSEGVQFQVYVREEQVLKGVFRRSSSSWHLECKCALESQVLGLAISEANVCLLTCDQHAPIISTKVEMKRRRRRRRTCQVVLEEIPEEREVSFFESTESSEGEEDEVEMEGVRWAVDVGIWVVCLGVAYLVSKAASSKGFRRRRNMF